MGKLVDSFTRQELQCNAERWTLVRMDSGGQPISLRAYVAEEIRALMGRRQTRNAGLAKVLGKSEMYVSRRINGQTAFDVDDLERIAAYFGVEVGDLMPRPNEGTVVATGGAPSARLNARKDGLSDQVNLAPEKVRKSRRRAKSRPIGRSPISAAGSGPAVPPTSRRPELLRTPS